MLSKKKLMGNIFRKSKHKSKRKDAGDAGDNLAAAGELQQQQQQQCIHSAAAVLCIAAVRDNNISLCLSGGEDSIVILTETTSGRVIKRWIQHTKDITKVSYSNSGDWELFFSGSRDKNIMLWKKESSQPISCLTGHELVVSGLDVSADGRMLCSGSRDNTVKLWDISRVPGGGRNDGGGAVPCVQSRFLAQNLVTHMKWFPGGSSLIAQSSEDKSVKLWDSRGLNEVGTLPLKQQIQTWCDVSDDQMYFISSSNGFNNTGCELTLWDVRTMRSVHEFKGHSQSVQSCCFIPPSVNSQGSATTATQLIASCSNDNTLRLWNVQTKECVAVSEISGAGSLTSVAADNTGRIYVSSREAAFLSCVNPSSVTMLGHDDDKKDISTAAGTLLPVQVEFFKG